MLDGVINVVLPVHNRRLATERFVGLLVGQTDQRYRLILVDDGSTDGTTAAVQALIPNAVVLHGDGSLWWAGCLQKAYRWLMQSKRGPADLVLIANDDTVMDAEFLATGRRVLSEHPRSLVLARLHGPDGQLEEVGVDVNWPRLDFRPVLDPALVNCFSTRGLFLTLADFLALGGFHPTILPHYASDYEFTMRARRRGFALISDEALRVRHDKVTGEPVRRPGVRAFLASRLSRRSHLNPVYWTAFILLASPRRFIPIGIARTWGIFCRDFMSAVRP